PSMSVCRPVRLRLAAFGPFRRQGVGGGARRARTLCGLATLACWARACWAWACWAWACRAWACRAGARSRGMLGWGMLGWGRGMRRSLGAIFAVAWLAAIGPDPSAARELRLSHQMPESDARHRAARVLAAELKKRAPDLAITIHPNSTLIADPPQQYEAIIEG